MAKIVLKDCTPENPMPEGSDAKTTRWTHHDVTEIEDFDMLGVLYECNSCKLRFVVR